MDISSAQLMQNAMSVMQAQTNGAILQRGVQDLDGERSPQNGAAPPAAFDGRGAHINVKA